MEFGNGTTIQGKDKDCPHGLVILGDGHVLKEEDTMFEKGGLFVKRKNSYRPYLDDPAGGIKV